MVFHPVVQRRCLEVFTQTVVSCKEVVLQDGLPSAVAARGLALQGHLWNVSRRAVRARCRGSGCAGLAPCGAQMLLRG